MEGQGRLTDNAINTFIAPKLAELTENNAPKIISQFQESQYWVSNFILNSIFGAPLDDKNRKFIFNILRRILNTINEYENGRNNLDSYICGQREVRSKYLAAVFHFENTITQSYQACLLLKTMNRIEKLYEKNDDSLLQRINTIYNDIKHLNERIEKGKLPEGFTIPMWLTNNGFESSSTAIDFEEFATFLMQLCSIADKLTNPIQNESF